MISKKYSKNSFFRVILKICLLNFFDTGYAISDKWIRKAEFIWINFQESYRFIHTFFRNTTKKVCIDYYDEEEKLKRRKYKKNRWKIVK